jgi:hypothetical protein
MNRTVNEILASKPESQLRIYAYEIHDEAHKGMLKVGHTTRDNELMQSASPSES